MKLGSRYRVFEGISKFRAVEAPDTQGLVTPVQPTAQANVAPTFSSPVFTISRVSTTGAGAQITGGGGSQWASFSPDGTSIVFMTTGTNLVGADTTTTNDVYVKNLATGAVTLVSSTSGGVVGNGASQYPSWSGDGTRIAFWGAASNLVAGDTNSLDDAFVKTLATGDVIRVSTSSAGVQGNGGSSNPYINYNSTQVVFQSDATNLITSDTNGVRDIFLKDLTSGATTLVSASAGGVQGNGASFNPFFSGDGSRVVFQSNANNLVAGDTNNATDIFVKTLSTGAITLVSSSAGNVIGNGASQNAVFSADGTKVIFESTASNLVAGDTNNVADIFVKDLVTGTITRVSTDSSGNQAIGGDSTYGVMSPDGTKVAFLSTASNLVADDTNGVADIFVKDLITGVVTRVSQSAAGVQGNALSRFPQFSPDSRSLVFESASTALVAGDTNAAYDIFLAAAGGTVPAPMRRAARPYRWLPASSWPTATAPASTAAPSVRPSPPAPTRATYWTLQASTSPWSAMSSATRARRSAR